VSTLGRIGDTAVPGSLRRATRLTKQFDVAGDGET